MVNKECNYLIYIIRSVLNNQEVIYQEDIDYKKLYNLAKIHTLLVFLYYGLKKYHIPTLSKILEDYYKNNIYKTAMQDAEKEIIVAELEKNHIKYMPLKGSIIKYLYPSIDLRTMCDFDCLFDKSKAKEVKKIFLNLGYEVESYNNSNHDIYIKKPFMTVEMHKELMNDSYMISRYYHSIWNNVSKADNKEYEYEMTKEDFYVFMIAHLAKHYVGGGAGIRNFIDIYLFNKNYINLNKEYINAELENLGLLTFDKYARELSLVWFEEKESNENIDKFAESIFESGIYGTVDQNVLKRICFNEEEINNLEESKIKFFFRRLFPTKQYMKQAFPILNEKPYLLLYFYLKRIFTLKSKLSRAKAEMKSFQKITQEDKEKVKDLHNKLGVKNKL